MYTTTTVPFLGDQPVASTEMVTGLKSVYINNMLNSYEVL